MTYLERYFKSDINKGEDVPAASGYLMKNHCPSAFFGVRREICRKCFNDEYSPVDMGDTVPAACIECWNGEYDKNNPPTAWCSKRHNIRNNPQFIKFFEDIQFTPLAKQELVLRIANEILDSEAFLEAYPVTNDATTIQKILTRVLWHNRVSTEAGRKMLLELAETYSDKKLQSLRSVGPSSSEISHSKKSEV